MRKHNMGDSSWHVLKHDPVTLKTIWVKFDEGMATIRETIPDWLADQIIESNKQKAKEFTEAGGWKRAKKGAIIASVPAILDTQFKRASGYDPTKGGEYDQAKYNAILDDIDYQHLRTGGGKIGRKSTNTPWLSKSAKKLIGVPNGN